MLTTGSLIARFTLTIVASFWLSGCASQQPQLTQSYQSSEFPSLIKHFKVLSSTEFQGRKTQTAGSVKTQQYLTSILTKAGISPFNGQYRHEFSFSKYSKNLTGTNVIGFIPCSNSPCERYIILSAHYDHLGQPANNRIYYGADDNASGTAALLSIAQRLAAERLNLNVLVLFTDAEELNLNGAKAFISSNPVVVDKAAININMDMLAGANETKTLHYISRGIDTLLGTKQKELKKLMRNQSINIRRNFTGAASGTRLSKRMWMNASDHGAFNRNNIPFIYFGVGTHKNYHTVKDTFENANKTMLIGATEAIYNVIMLFDSEIKRTNR
ncbi:M20/M25/M40 family metallo-hydrolase [Thalassotalea fusca]